MQSQQNKPKTKQKKDHIMEMKSNNDKKKKKP